MMHSGLPKKQKVESHNSTCITPEYIIRKTKHPAYCCGCEIHFPLKSRVCKLSVILRSRVLRVCACRFYVQQSGLQNPARTVFVHNEFAVFFSHIPFIFFALFFLSPSRNSDPGSHSRLFSPLPTTVRALHFYRENISALSPLVDSRRIVLTHARRSQQLGLFLFMQMSLRSHHGGIRTPVSTILIVVGSTRGYHVYLNNLNTLI